MKSPAGVICTGCHRVVYAHHVDAEGRCVLCAPAPAPTPAPKAPRRRPTTTEKDGDV